MIPAGLTVFSISTRDEFDKLVPGSKTGNSYRLTNSNTGTFPASLATVANLTCSRFGMRVGLNIEYRVKLP